MATKAPTNQFNLDINQLNSDISSGMDYRGLCELMVERYTYGRTGIYPSAIDAANAYAGAGKLETDTSGLQYGDTIYFNNGGAGHAAIYVGDGKMLSATDNGVMVSDINQWVQSTGQQMLGYISKDNYAGSPPPQALTSQFMQSSQNTADNSNQEFQNAPADQQDTTGLTTPSQTYTVQAGDTLSGIAQKLLGDGSRWKELQGFTGDPRQLPIGTQLTVPGGPVNPNQPVAQQFVPQPIIKLPQQQPTNNQSISKIQIPKNPGTTTSPQQNVGGVTNPGANGPAIKPQSPNDSGIFRALNPVQGVQDAVTDVTKGVPAIANAVGGAVGSVTKALASGPPPPAQNAVQQPAPAAPPPPSQPGGPNPFAQAVTQGAQAIQNPLGGVQKAITGAVGSAANSVMSSFQPKPPTGIDISSLANGPLKPKAMKAAANMITPGTPTQQTNFNQQPQQPSTSPYNLPSATHLVQPVFARSFGAGMRVPQQQPTYTSQPNSFTTSAGKIINNVANAVNQPKARSSAGSGPANLYNQVGNAVNSGFKTVGNDVAGAARAVGGAVSGFGNWLMGDPLTH